MKSVGVLIVFVAIVAAQAQTFLYTKFSDAMQEEFLGRKNGITLTDPDAPNTIYVGYGTPVEPAKTVIVMQKFSPPTLNSFPPQPLETLVNSTYNDRYGPPQASMIDEQIVCVASKVLDGVVLTMWGPNPVQSNTEMEYKTYDKKTSWSDVLNTTFSQSTRIQLTSMAVNRDEQYPRVAVAVNFDTEFRVFIYNVTYLSGTFLVSVVDTAPPAGKEITSVSLMTLNGSEYMVAYAMEESTNNWKGVIQVIGADFTVRDFMRINGTGIRRIHNIQLTPSKLPGYFFVTAQLTNTTHTLIRRTLVRKENGSSGTVVGAYEIVALFNSNSFVSAMDQLSSGEIVTVWINNKDDRYIYGHSRNDGEVSSDAFTFKIPSATPTGNISRLIVSPLSDSTFAVTQVVIFGDTPSSFINYYVLSNCADGIITPNENCQAGQDGCVDCMCSESTGWYSTDDGVTCRTSCDDGIIAGNETCFNANDTNCVNCMCVDDLKWNIEEQLCLVPAPTSNSVVTPVASVPEGGGVEPKPFNNNLIAAIVCVPVVVGAAIFFGVFFGHRNAKKKKQGEDSGDIKDDLPLQPLDSGKYSSVEPLTPVKTNDNKYGAISTVTEMPKSKDVDKMNVPYTDLKFIKEIGSGAYGKVFIGEWQRTKVALKINTLASGDEFAREAKLMVDLRPHPNVVQMLGVSSDGPYPVMILEFCDGGSLDTKLFQTSEMSNLNEQLLRVSGIAKGLYHLHKNQIVHRDLAARNILLNFNQPKISDFGLSRLVNDTQKGTTRSNVGPIRWMSPESLKSQTYSPKSDVWSFGVVVYEIVARKEPHAEADQMAIGLQIRDSGLSPGIPEDCDPCLRALMEKCWQLDPEQRPTMEQICDVLDTYMQQNKIL